MKLTNGPLCPASQAFGATLTGQSLLPSQSMTTLLSVRFLETEAAKFRCFSTSGFTKELRVASIC
ncbi:hypothetical protein BFP70_13705 [Thioclava sp. SK-1]|nr:hypothetical protein BFP70_13705 [Thioclava sp. SK-1]